MSAQDVKAPERLWVCPVCRCSSGRAGHIGCTRGGEHVSPVEYVPRSPEREPIWVFETCEGERPDYIVATDDGTKPDPSACPTAWKLLPLYRDPQPDAEREAAVAELYAAAHAYWGAASGPDDLEDRLEKALVAAHQEGETNG